MIFELFVDGWNVDKLMCTLTPDFHDLVSNLYHRTDDVADIQKTTQTHVKTFWKLEYVVLITVDTLSKGQGLLDPGGIYSVNWTKDLYSEDHARQINIS